MKSVPNKNALRYEGHFLVVAIRRLQEACDGGCNGNGGTTLHGNNIRD